MSIVLTFHGTFNYLKYIRPDQPFSKNWEGKSTVGIQIVRCSRELDPLTCRKLPEFKRQRIFMQAARGANSASIWRLHWEDASVAEDAHMFQIALGLRATFWFDQCSFRIFSGVRIQELASVFLGLNIKFAQVLLYFGPELSSPQDQICNSWRELVKQYCAQYHSKEVIVPVSKYIVKLSTL